MGHLKLLSLLPSIILVAFLSVPLVFASDLGGRAVNIDGRYGGCANPKHGASYYYGGSAVGVVDSCNGAPNYTVKLCDRQNCQTDSTLENWDGPRYTFPNFGEADFDATVEPIFDNGKNAPDGAIFDHWDSYAIGDYDAKKLYEESGTTLPANVHIYDPLHNGTWFYYRYPTNNASCSSVSAPDTVTINQSFTASIQLSNNGETAWTSGNNYHLGSQNTENNTTWGPNRVFLSAEPVGQGGLGIFNFTAFAPSTPGTYDFYWKMVQDGGTPGGWFGNLCGKRITVLAPPSTPTPTPTPVPPTPTPTPIPPLVNSLRVNNSTTPSVTGTYRVSGLTTSDGGSNWLNPINIILSGTAYGTNYATGTSNSIRQYYVAFYDQNSGQAPNLSNLQSKANNPANGFLLSSTASPTTHSVWDPHLNKDPQTNRCVPGWVDITTQSNGYSIRDCSSDTIYFMIFPGTNAGNWKARFYPAFGNKTLYNAVQVTDANNQWVFWGNYGTAP